MTKHIAALRAYRDFLVILVRAKKQLKDIGASWPSVNRVPAWVIDEELVETYEQLRELETK